MSILISGRCVTGPKSYCLNALSAMKGSSGACELLERYPNAADEISLEPFVKTAEGWRFKTRQFVTVRPGPQP